MNAGERSNELRERDEGTEADEIFCQECGETVLRKAIVCPNCGVSLEKTESVPELAFSLRRDWPETSMAILGGFLTIVGSVQGNTTYLIFGFSVVSGSIYIIRLKKANRALQTALSNEGGS